MKRVGRSLGGVSDKRYRSERHEDRNKILTHERRQFFNFDLLINNKAAAALLPWRLANNGNGIPRAISKTIERACARWGT